MPRPGHSLDLRTISREDLLNTRLCDLPIALKGSWVARSVTKLYSELEAKGLRFKPHVWVSDDWFSPDGIPGFAVPFYLLHPRLISLEKEMIGEAEGGDTSWCMKLMRHESGHAIDNAFHLRKNKTRQSLFGLTSKTYPKSYLPNTRSRNFVRHLEGHYAQAHPDEDWAETFAVWLTPRSPWRRQYANWPAIEKLHHLNNMMISIAGERPLVNKRERMDDIATMTKTVGEYYKEKRARLGLNRRAPFATDLKRIFPKSGNQPAWRAITNSQGEIVGQVAKNTRLQHYKIKRMLREVTKTCRQEGLMVDNSSSDQSQNINQSVIKMMTEKSAGFLKRSRPRIIM